MTPNAQAAKSELSKWEYIQLKSLYPHFREAESEVKMLLNSWLHNYWVGGLEFEPNLPGLRACSLTIADLQYHPDILTILQK